MISALLLRLAPWKWIGVGLVMLGLVGVIGVDRIQIAGLRTVVADGKRAMSDLLREQARAAFVASEGYRKKEAADRQRVEDSENAYRTAQAEWAKRLAREVSQSRAAIADNDGLRADLASFARGRDPASDTVAAAGERAAALGLVLAEALRLEDETLLVAAEATGGAESNGDAVRTLLSAWPR